MRVGLFKMWTDTFTVFEADACSSVTPLIRSDPLTACSPRWINSTPLIFLAPASEFIVTAIRVVVSLLGCSTITSHLNLQFVLCTGFGNLHCASSTVLESAEYMTLAIDLSTDWSCRQNLVAFGGSWRSRCNHYRDVGKVVAACAIYSCRRVLHT